MSVQVMSWVIQHAPDDLTATEMLVALMLAEHADREGGHAFPSVGMLSRETRQSDRSVQRSLKRLVERGIIEVEIPATNRLPAMYCFPFFRGDNLTPQENLGVTKMSSRGDKTTPKPLDITVSSVNPSGLTPPIAPPLEFSAFWALYRSSGHGGSKKLAEQSWSKLSVDDRAAAMEAIPVWLICQRWQEGYVKDAHRWLRDHQFNDDPPADRPSNGHANGHATGQLGIVERFEAGHRYLQQQAQSPGCPPAEAGPAFNTDATYEAAFWEGEPS